MFGLIEMVNFAAVRTLLVSIPESFGLLVFGIALVTVAVMIRRLLSRMDVPKRNEKLGEKAGQIL